MIATLKEEPAKWAKARRDFAAFGGTTSGLLKKCSKRRKRPSGAKEAAEKVRIRGAAGAKALHPFCGTSGTSKLVPCYKAPLAVEFFRNLAVEVFLRASVLN
jgi:hypothetical protein